MHFDKFYSTKLGNIIKIDDITDDMKSSLDFYRRYGYELYCPECKKAKLKYSSPSDKGNRKSFISAIRIKDHDSNCKYKYEYVSRNEAKSIADNRLCTHTLKRIVDRMLVHIFTTSDVDRKTRDETIAIEKIQTSNTEIKRKIFKKNINNISIEDKDYFYYYGKTKLKFINNYYKNVIQVQINNKKLHFFNINLSEKMDIDLLEEKMYCISFFANVSIKAYNGVDYPEINLLNNDCIYIKEYEE